MYLSVMTPRAADAADVDGWLDTLLLLSDWSARDFRSPNDPSDGIPAFRLLCLALYS